MITKKDFAELNNVILNSIPDRVHLVNGSWLPESLRTRLESYLSDNDIEHAINIVADGALHAARAGPYLAEVLRSKGLSKDLRVQIREALAKASITGKDLLKIGIEKEIV